MRAHDRPRPGGDGGPERREFALAQQVHVGVDPRQRVVRVDRGVAVPGEVLGAGGDAGGLQPLDVGRGVPGDRPGLVAEGPHSDHRVGGVGVDVRGGRPVEVDAALGEPPPQFGGDPAGEVDVVDRAERVVAGEGGPGADLQPGDVAALLVDGDEDVLALLAQLRGQRGELLRGVDVAAEEADRGEALAEPAQQPVGRGGPGEAGLEHGQRVPGERVHAWCRGGHRRVTPSPRPRSARRRPCAAGRRRRSGWAGRTARTRPWWRPSCRRRWSGSW